MQWSPLADSMMETADRWEKVLIRVQPHTIRFDDDFYIFCFLIIAKEIAVMNTTIVDTQTVKVGFVY